jgi:hypothetical protein
MPACSTWSPADAGDRCRSAFATLLSPDFPDPELKNINSLLLIHSWLARTAVISRPFTKSRALVAGSCVKYREISDKMVTDIAATSAEAVLAGDLGCLLNMARKLYRQARQVEVRHVAEVLAGMADRVPAIGAPR